MTFKLPKKRSAKDKRKWELRQRLEAAAKMCAKKERAWYERCIAALEAA